MDKQVESTFQFDTYRVERIEFRLNPDFDAGKCGETIPLQHSIEVVVSVSEDLHQGKVTLNSKVFEDAERSNYPFSLEVSLTGYFSTQEIMNREELGRFCEINGTAALFPFLRSIIADVTKAANFQPLLLPLMNIHNLVEQSKRAIQSQ